MHSATVIWLKCVWSFYHRHIFLIWSARARNGNKPEPYLNKDWGCAILREIDFLLKICWSIPCLQPSWKVHTWIEICTSLNHRKKTKADGSRLIPRKHTETLVLLSVIRTGCSFFLRIDTNMLLFLDVFLTFIAHAYLHKSPSSLQFLLKLTQIQPAPHSCNKFTFSLIWPFFISDKIVTKCYSKHFFNAALRDFDALNHFHTDGLDPRRFREYQLQPSSYTIPGNTSSNQTFCDIFHPHPLRCACDSKTHCQLQN